jgi:tetrahydromethanopterin S-methyltransferase subunit H
MSDQHAKIKARDLRQKRLCSECGKPHTAHMVPYGEPMILLVTGWCEHCQSTKISFDSPDGDVRAGAGQLAAFFGQVAGLTTAQH